MTAIQQTTPQALANAQYPAHIQALVDKEKKYADNFGNIDASDLALNMLKIVHGQSPQARDGWGPNNDKKALPIGTMFLSRDGSVVPAGTAFVPLVRDCTYILWEGRPGDGRMVFSTKDKNDPRIVDIDGLSFKTDPRTNERKPPAVTTYVNFYVMLSGHADMPVLLSFKRTGMPDAKRLTQDLMVATKGGEIPMWALLFQLNQPKEVRDGQLFWHLMSWSPAGFVPDAYTEKARSLAEMAREFISFASDRVIAAVEHDDNMSQTTVDAHPNRVNIPSTPNTPVAPPISSGPLIPPAPAAQPTYQAPAVTVQPAALPVTASTQLVAPVTSAPAVTAAAPQQTAKPVSLF